MNIYLQLTKQFNDGRLRAILAGGQAVVLHRLAMMSKDGDWIHANEDRLALYQAAAEDWSRRWPDLSAKVKGRPLADAHAAMVAAADGVLPFTVPGGLP